MLFETWVCATTDRQAYVSFAKTDQWGNYESLWARCRRHDAIGTQEKVRSGLLFPPKRTSGMKVRSKSGLRIFLYIACLDIPVVLSLNAQSHVPTAIRRRKRNSF